MTRTPQLSSFADELKRFGPSGTAPPLSESESLEYCRRLARSHYENFSVASLLLPQRLRDPMMVVYAYCRWSDDLGDELGGSEEERKTSLDLLDWWGKKLDECFQTESDIQPVHPVFRALQPMVKRFELPKKPFADLLIAFRQDQTKRNYSTLDELIQYCRNSANPVGRIVLHLAYKVSGLPLPVEGNAIWHWSDSICTGLQLANFWQDVARDAKLGRCYIPENIAGRHGVKLETMTTDSSPESAKRFKRMIRFLVEDARNELQSGRHLIRAAPKLIRTDLKLFLHGGLAILDAIEKIDYNVLQIRPIVSRWQKLKILLRSLFHIS